MSLKFKRIILFARQYRTNQGVVETINRLLEFLSKQNIEVFIAPETASHFSLSLPAMDRQDMGKEQDLIIVVGGDGSLLAASRLAVKVQVPVIGINRGRLGFLTDINPTEIESALLAVLRGEYQKEQRFLLQARIYDEHETYFTGEALNDVVLARGNAPHLAEFEVFINEQFISRYHADGMIIATPTGSTAYALSAGGPIMHPELNAMVMVPMFSHSLSSRPLVVDGDIKLILKISQRNVYNLRLSCDGQESRLAKPGQSILIGKHTEKLCLLHPLDYHYYDRLRMKLGWEAQHRG